MILYSNNKKILFDELLLILSTDEILTLVPEFEKLIQGRGNYTILYQYFEDEKNKNISFKIYEKGDLSYYDERQERLIQEKTKF